MRGPTRPNPTRPHHAFEKLISLERVDRFTSGLLVRCHHSINFVFDLHRYPPVLATARGTCRARGCRRHPILDNSMTAGPIAFKFGVRLETIQLLFLYVRDGMHLHMRTCTPLFHISRTAWSIVLKIVVWLGTHSVSLTEPDVGPVCTCVRAHPFRTMVPSRSLVHRRSRRHTGIR